MDDVRRFAKLIFGLLLFAFGYYLSIQANIGLAPWSAFTLGVALRTGSTYGVVSIVTAVVIIGVNLALREQIGWGTVLDTLLVGPFVDLFSAWGLVPLIDSFWVGLPVLLAGLEIVCIGSYFYISAALSAGPRDTLMVALCKRFPRAPVALIRCLIEGLALLVGWLCGAKVGVGTVISVFGLGVMLQLTFQAIRFDVKSVKNEDVLATCRRIAGRRKNPST